MTFSIEDIKSKLEHGGSRPSLFSVVITLPDALQYAGKGAYNNKIEFLCKAASLPKSTSGAIDVPYFGRKIKVAGNRTFEDWTVTVINDEDFALRDAFEFWHNAINGRRSNVTGNGISSSPATYKTTAIVRQYAKDEDAGKVRKYKIEGIFPLDVSAVELSWASENEISETQVTFALDLWDLDNTVE